MKTASPQPWSAHTLLIRSRTSSRSSNLVGLTTTAMRRDGFTPATLSRTRRSHLSGPLSPHMPLPAHVVGLRQPAGELGVDVVRSEEPERVQDVPRREDLDPAPARRRDLASQDEVPVEPRDLRLERGEAHPHVPGDPGPLGEHLHGTEPLDHRERRLVARSNGGLGPREVGLHVTQWRAGMRLVPCRERPPAARAGPHQAEVVYRSATASAWSRMAIPWCTSSAVMTQGGHTWVRFMWMNGHSPADLQALPNSAIGAAAAPLALNGTSGSLVDRSRTSSSAQNTPSPRTSPTEGCWSASSRRAGPI